MSCLKSAIQEKNKDRELIARQMREFEKKNGKVKTSKTRLGDNKDSRFNTSKI